jgi:CRISPR-associated endonuclease Csn1
MHFDYWKNKLDRFTRTEIPNGFINSQLTDTQLITKYAFHYLKTVFNKVDVVKGTNTAQFRKIYGIQAQQEGKSRDKHYHHAVDAAVLTLIPNSRKREDILKKAYEFEEVNRGNQYHEKPFEEFNYSKIKEIEENLLINNIANKDQTLQPAKKIIRKRGRIVWLDKLKKEPKIAQGDSIRGELHQQTYYGKIRLVERDESQKPIRDEDKNWKYLTGKNEYKYVLRKPIEQITKLSEIVDPYLAKMIDEQLNGRSFKKAVTEGVWMIDKNGNKVNKIRRVRCWTGITEPLSTKKQTYLSKHEYKQSYYAANAENYAYALYEGEVNNKLIREFEIINLFDLSELMKFNDSKIINIERFKTINSKGDKIPFKALLKPQLKVILYLESKEELKEFEIHEISKRLYSIVKFMKDGRMTLKHHMEARSDEQLLLDFPDKEFGKKGKNGFSQLQSEFQAPKLMLSKGNLNFIIEGIDFKMQLDGKIDFLF